MPEIFRSQNELPSWKEHRKLSLEPDFQTREANHCCATGDDFFAPSARSRFFVEIFVFLPTSVACANYILERRSERQKIEQNLLYKTHILKVQPNVPNYN